MHAPTFWGSGVTCIEFATASKKLSSNSSERNEFDLEYNQGMGRSFVRVIDSDMEGDL